MCCEPFTGEGRTPPLGQRRLAAVGHTAHLHFPPSQIMLNFTAAKHAKVPSIFCYHWEFSPGESRAKIHHGVQVGARSLHWKPKLRHAWLRAVRVGGGSHIVYNLSGSKRRAELCLSEEFRLGWSCCTGSPDGNFACGGGAQPSDDTMAAASSRNIALNWAAQ